jgi:hypothetical protein
VDFSLRPSRPGRFAVCRLRLHGYAVSAEQESDCAGALSKIAGKPRLTGEKVGSTHPFQSIGEFGHFVERERGDVDAHLTNPDLEGAPSRQVAGRHDNGFLIGLFPCNAPATRHDCESGSRGEPQRSEIDSIVTMRG